jgi:site-specific DNA recombinase
LTGIGTLRHGPRSPRPSGLGSRTGFQTRTEGPSDSLSRLARSTKDAITISERLGKAGADLVSLSEKIDTTSAAGKMVFRMLAVLAEFERDIVSERTSAAMQHKRSRHQYTGGVAPYGWRVAGDRGTLIAHAREQTAIREARTLKAAGFSLRAIGVRLEGKGLRPRSGGRWHAKTVRDLLSAALAEPLAA